MQERETDSSEVRLADRNDAPEISRVLREAFEEFKPLYTPAGFTATTPTSEEILIRLTEGPVWIASQKGVIVGTAAAVNKGDSLYVRGMAVLPAARGQRIGELLLGRIERFALDQRCKRLFLSTTPFLHRAIRLYEYFGFRRTYEGPTELFGTPLFTMTKELEVAAPKK